MYRTKTFTAGVMAVIVSVVLGSVLPASAGNPLPFKGYADAVLTGVEVDGTDLILSAVATGKATHLGNYTRSETLTLHVDGTFEAEIIFIAANGDELWAEATGSFTAPGKAVGVATFTGGEGRFTNASGEYDFVAITGDGSHFSITFQGAIQYPQKP